MFSISCPKHTHHFRVRHDKSSQRGMLLQRSLFDTTPKTVDAVLSPRSDIAKSIAFQRHGGKNKPTNLWPLRRPLCPVRGLVLIELRPHWKGQRHNLYSSMRLDARNFVILHRKRRPSWKDGVTRAVTNCSFDLENASGDNVIVCRGAIKVAHPIVRGMSVW